jgi:hypothetical protein
MYDREAFQEVDYRKMFGPGARMQCSPAVDSAYLAQGLPSLTWFLVWFGVFLMYSFAIERRCWAGKGGVSSRLSRADTRVHEQSILGAFPVSFGRCNFRLCVSMK